MPPLMHLGLANAACAAVLAILAVVVGRVCRRPALTHALWLLVLIKLITPPVFSIPLAWLPAAADEEAAVVIAESTPFALNVSFDWEPENVGPPLPADVWLEMEKARAQTALLLEVPPLAPTKPADPPMAPNAVPVRVPIVVEPRTAVPAPLVVAESANRPAADSSGSVLRLLALAWLGGSALWFLRTVLGLLRFQRLLRHARPASARVRELTRQAAEQLGLRRCPEVALLPAALPPMVWAGLGPARVYLPARLLDRLDDDQVTALLTHELAHICRGDHWVRRLELVSLGLFWWYPLAWWARTRLQAEEEECCDAWVVEKVPARVYASAIIETVDFLASDLAGVPALASGLGRCQSLKRRLTQIFTNSAPKRLNFAGRLIVLAVALGLLPLLPLLARAEKKPSEPAVSQQEPEPPKTVDPSNEAIAFRPEPLLLTGGDNQVPALAVSPDGRYLAAGTGFFNRPGEVRVWTMADHKEVLVYATAQGVATVAFSPDGRLLASSGYDGQAVIREFPSGKVVAVLPLDAPTRLCFSPDGRYLVTATESGLIKVWDPTTGREIRRIENTAFRCYCLAWSPDGKLLAIGGGDINNNNVPNQVTLWETTDFQPIGSLKDHKNPIMSVAFSPDSQMLATGSIDRTARLWQVEGLKALGTLEGHEDWVKALTFTPDGKTLATGSHDGSVRLWDVAKQMPLTRLDGHIAPVRAVAVSPDGKLLFSGGAERILKVWDLASHKEVAGYQLSPERAGGESILLAMTYSPDGRTLATAHENGTIALRSASNGDLLLTLDGHQDAATCLVFSWDGKTLISGSADRTIRLWDVATGKVRATLARHTSWVYALALSPDGKTLASGGYDKTIRLWDLETLQEKALLQGHKGAVRALAFAPDGQTLASGAGDQAIKLWDLATLREKQALSGHEGTVRALVFSPDGKTLASGSEDASIRLWDGSGAVRAVMKGHGNKVCALAFSPHGRYLVSASMDSTCRLWDATTGQAVQTLRDHEDSLTCLAWTPDGRFLVTGGYHPSLKLWVVTTGPVRMLTGHTSQVQTACFSPDGKLILSCSSWPNGDNTIRLWDATTGKELRQFTGHIGQVGWAAFTPDGKHALSGGFDRTARLWDVSSGKMLHVLPGHEREVQRLAVSPDGKRAATGSDDKTVRVWDLETGQCRQALSGHAEAVRGVAFSPDSKRIVSCGLDAAIRIWDAERGAQTQVIPLSRGQIRNLALSPDGSRVAVAQENAVRILDLESGRQLRQLDGHGQEVTAVAWSPDGKRLLSGSSDATARLWDLATGRELHLFQGHRNRVLAVNFSPDGRRILTAGGGGRNGDQEVAGNDFAIRLWPLPDTSPKAGRVLKFTIKQP